MTRYTTLDAPSDITEQEYYDQQAEDAERESLRETDKNAYDEWLDRWIYGCPGASRCPRCSECSYPKKRPPVIEEETEGCPF